MNHFRADRLNHFRNVVTKMELEIEKTCRFYKETPKDVEVFNITLPETNITPENGWLEDDPFVLRRPIFRCVCC